MKQTIILLLALLLVLSGCDRYLLDEDPVDTAPPDGPVATSVVPWISDGAVTLTWDANNGSAVSRWRIYIASSQNDSYVLQDSTVAPPAKIVDLTNFQRYWFRVAAVMVDGLEANLSEVVSAVPSRLGMTINSGQQFTNNRTISVNLTANDLAETILISERDDLAGAVWRSYEVPMLFELSAGDGPKSLYARVDFSDGTLSADTLTARITLDTEAGIDSVWFSPADSAFVPGDTVRFFLKASESGGEASINIGELGVLTMRNDGSHGDLTADDTIYSGRLVVPAIAVAGGSVTGGFRDHLGNIALPLTSIQLLTILFDPGPVGPEPTSAASR